MSKPIHAGDLDQLISIESKSVTRDSATGAEVVTWVAVETVWARVVESATASEGGMQSGLASYARPTRVWVRWRDDVDTSMRLIAESGQVLQIMGTAAAGRREWLELACKEWAHE